LRRFKGYELPCRSAAVVVVIDVAIKAGFACDWGWHKVRLIDKTAGCITETKYRYCETWKKERSMWKGDYIITNRGLPPRMLKDETDGFTPAAAVDGPGVLI
jgi:hypothetical protein